MTTEKFPYANERFADIQMLRYRLNGFEKLTPRQRLYIYYLSNAALAGRDIIYEQNGRYNLAIRKLLESVYQNYKGDRENADFKGLSVYLRRLWFSNGIYHHYACDKFEPQFSRDFLEREISSLPAEKKNLLRGQNIDELLRVIFCPEVLPKRVNKADGEDLVVTSACNYYEGVTQQEAERFYATKREKGPKEEPPSYGLNSRLVKTDGRIREMRCTTQGLYGKALSQICSWLSLAAEVAENERQSHLLQMLIEYYTTGDLHLFDQFSIEWLKETQGQVDFINGFIEVYGDPLGIKASWEGFVSYKDTEATRRTQIISQDAQWFEDNSPTDPRFHKSRVKGVTANVVCAAMLGGDEYPSSAIGINLPNADWIRAEYGSKSVTIGNLTEAYDEAAKHSGMRQEFVSDSETIALIDRYGTICDDLHTDLHECLGHGSGQLLPGVSGDELKSYGSTIEEARADLFGLYYLADDKMVELGLLPDHEAYKAQYYSYMMNGLLTQLTRIKPNRQIEEAHMRNRALIARWALEHSDGAVSIEERGGKHYVAVNDYPRLRSLFAELLAEIQRIKSEGDYEAARNLVETYGVKVDPVLHSEVLSRYEKLGIAPYKGFINPRLALVLDADGKAADVTADYSESYEEQMLRYSSEFGLL